MTPRPDCPRCKGTQFTHMPDSLAEACDNCGFVWVGGIAGMEWEPGATIGQWLEIGRAHV